MPIPKNSFILIDYELRTKDTNELIDTTIEEIAKKENKYEAERVYEPLLVIVGENRVIQGLEEHIETSAEPNKEYEIVVPPEKAYGLRDPSKVKTYNLRALLQRNIAPEVNKTVEIDGQIGIVKAVSGGRVLIDFNHPLAGKTILCRYKVVKVIEDATEKVKWLLHRRYRRSPLDRFNVSVDQDKKAITIELPKELYLDRDLQLVKALIVEEIYRYIGDLKTVVYIEKYEKEG
ncbi:MAG: FKBP-type peptidyl-prolyl cis-trans isomerase [Ignisphaera sp.]|uniref:Peptidyl-prolyl cis-trans isomerase n=1 Tax=Ignisphaera aggregans TaxID=334771 RepID=A0A7C4JID7_9CREN